MPKTEVVATPPVGYPTITINGETLEVRFSFLAEYALDQLGLSMQMVHQILRRTGPGKVGIFMKLFAACVVHNYVERGEVAPTPEQWALTVKTAAEFKAITDAVVAALVKAKPPAETIPLQESEAKPQV